jgi:hypothetical protein
MVRKWAAIMLTADLLALDVVTLAVCMAFAF